MSTGEEVRSESISCEYRPKRDWFSFVSQCFFSFLFISQFLGASRPLTNLGFLGLIVCPPFAMFLLYYNLRPSRTISLAGDILTTSSIWGKTCIRVSNITSARLIRNELRVFAGATRIDIPSAAETSTIGPLEMLLPELRSRCDLVRAATRVPSPLTMGLQPKKYLIRLFLFFACIPLGAILAFLFFTSDSMIPFPYWRFEKVILLVIGLLWAAGFSALVFFHQSSITLIEVVHQRFRFISLWNEIRVPLQDIKRIRFRARGVDFGTHDGKVLTTPIRPNNYPHCVWAIALKEACPWIDVELNFGDSTLHVMTIQLNRSVL
jgi:hypothetical protein